MEETHFIFPKLSTETPLSRVRRPIHPDHASTGRPRSPSTLRSPLPSMPPSPGDPSERCDHPERFRADPPSTPDPAPPRRRLTRSGIPGSPQLRPPLRSAGPSHRLCLPIHAIRLSALLLRPDPRVACPPKPLCAISGGLLIPSKHRSSTSPSSIRTGHGASALPVRVPVPFPSASADHDTPLRPIHRTAARPLLFAGPSHPPDASVRPLPSIPPSGRSQLRDILREPPSRDHTAQARLLWAPPSAFPPSFNPYGILQGLFANLKHEESFSSHGS